MVDFEKVSLNSKASIGEMKTEAVVATGTINLSSALSGIIKIQKSGPGNNVRVTDTFTSHPGISLTANNSVSNNGFGNYEISIDDTKFNSNNGRFQESVSFEVTDNFVTDVISRPIIFQIGNITDSRDPSDLARMYFLAEISSIAVNMETSRSPR